MNRIVLSILGGLAIPVGYTTILGFCSEFWPAYFPDTTIVFGHPAPGLIFAPTLFPIYFDEWLGLHNYLGYGLNLDNIWFRVPLVVIPNIILYSLITWLVLRTFSLLKKETEYCLPRAAAAAAAAAE